jgi:energy-coupling factor transport system permease protein
MQAGLYLPGNGLLHRWHPLTKLALLLAASLVGFAHLGVVGGIPLLAPALGLVMGLLALADSRQTFLLWLHRLLLLLLPFLISLLLVQGFFFPHAQEMLWQLGPLALKAEGLRFALKIIGRLFLIIGASLLLLLTTTPPDLALALTEAGLPREIAYLFTTALQLLPRMHARSEAILNAQRARGLRTEGSLLLRLRALLPLAGPLIGSALLETDERALALEARAFRAPGPKTSLRTLPDSSAQRLARWLLVISAAALFVGSLLT